MRVGAGNSSAIPDLPWLAWRNGQVNFMEPPGTCTIYTKHCASGGRYLYELRFTHSLYGNRSSLQSWLLKSKVSTGTEDGSISASISSVSKTDEGKRKATELVAVGANSDAKLTLYYYYVRINEQTI